MLTVDKYTYIPYETDVLTIISVKCAKQFFDQNIISLYIYINIYVCAYIHLCVPSIKKFNFQNVFVSHIPRR
jgi:hypothetical protein